MSASKSVAETMVNETLQKISDGRVKPLLADIASSTSIIEAHKKSIEKNSAEILKIKQEMDEVAKTMWAAFENTGA